MLTLLAPAQSKPAVQHTAALVISVLFLSWSALSCALPGWPFCASPSSTDPTMLTLLRFLLPILQRQDKRESIPHPSCPLAPGLSLPLKQYRGAPPSPEVLLLFAWPSLPFGHQPCSVPSSNRSVTTDESECASGLPPASPSSKLSLLPPFCCSVVSSSCSYLCDFSSDSPRPDQPLHTGFLMPSVTHAKVKSHLSVGDPKLRLHPRWSRAAKMAKASAFHTQKHRPIPRSLATSSTAPSSVPSSVYDLNAGVIKTHPQALLCTELFP